MTRILAAIVGAIVTAAPLAAAEPQSQSSAATVNAVQLLAADVARHPRAAAADLYKFLHQALFGPGHAIPDPAAAAAYLDREIAGLGPARSLETRCNMLGGDPALVRVNLRPFLREGHDPGALLESFIETANEVPGDPQQMALALGLVVQWLASENMAELSADLEKLAAETASRGYPAVHHSEAYIAAYAPAYRVVAAADAATHGWCN
ncbi:MAG: hypothetical protein PVG92_01020 [Holophagae bacterium]